MSQARGSQLAVNIYEEDTYGAAPDTPVAQRVYVTGFSISSSAELQEDPTLDPSRGMSQPTVGNTDVGGNVPMTLAAEDSATLMKHAIGSVTSYRPVVDTTVNVTGVAIVRAQKTCPTGDGTLSFAFAGTTLAWAANGDTAGAAVDVSGGGSFTLQSGTAGAELYVTVTAGSLPGSDKSDTITVSAAYEHEYAISDLPAGLTIERDYGSAISGSGRFEQFHGCRVSNLGVKAPQNGYIEATFAFKGASSKLASTALDAVPDDYGHTSFHSSSITTLEEGGSAIAVVTEHDWSLDNELDDSGYVQGASARAQLPEGRAKVAGNLTALFTSPALLTKAVNNTTSSLRCVLSRGTGDGTAGNEYISYEIPNLVYERKSPEVSGPAGVRVALAFRGFKSGSDLGLTVIMRNLVETP